MRKSPWGDAPAYHTPGSDVWPGVSQKTWATLRAGLPLAARGKAGGLAASCQVTAPSAER